MGLLYMYVYMYVCIRGSFALRNMDDGWGLDIFMDSCVEP